MKSYLTLLTALVLFFGCGESNLDDAETLDKILAEAIDRDKIQIRGEEGEKLFYAPNEQTPYTGWIKELYKNGQVKELIHLKDGEPIGASNIWYENGQKMAEINYKDGKQNGLTTSWYENGQKRNEANFKDGKLISCEVWKINGEKCPVSNIVNGNGKLVKYNDNGSENSRAEFEDGEVSWKKKTAQTWVNSTGEAYVNSYLALVGYYPKSLSDLQNPPDGIPTFVKRASDLKDPWGKDYVYQYPGTRNTESFDLSTTAPDGTLISNW